MCSKTARIFLPRLTLNCRKTIIENVEKCPFATIPARAGFSQRRSTLIHIGRFLPMAKKMTVDGNTAVSHVAYAFSDVAAIYPITPSSPMAEVADEWAAHGRKNLFGQTVRITEMQSEAGAAGAVHGSLAGRCADHHVHRVSGPAADDPQHVQDRRRAAALRVPRLAPARWRTTRCPSSATTPTSWPAARPALRCWPPTPFRRPWTWRWSPTCPPSRASVPFLHFFDGFRTSHEIQKIDAHRLRRDRQAGRLGQGRRASAPAALNPEHPPSARHRAEPRHLLPGP